MTNNEDYYWENGLMVFTASYHLKRGYCCSNECRHCPYRSPKKSERPKVTMSWSGGKDSAFALYKILNSQEVDVISLHTIIDAETNRVGLHGIREELIEEQASCIDLPLLKIYLPRSNNHEAYKVCMLQFYDQCAGEGIEGVVFGDIFLEDLKNFRIDLLKQSKLFPIFPLWKLDSKALVNDFINMGFKTTICSADANLFDDHRLGSVVDVNFLDSLPANVDPCGENGEFHSFVYDGPLFRRPVTIVKGELVKKVYSYQRKANDGTTEKVESNFWFQDFNLQ